MNKLQKSFNSSIAAVIIAVLILFFAVDTGFSLYRPSRYTQVLPDYKLTISSGTVQVQRPDKISWEEAEDGMTLGPSSQIRTAPDSSASLTFFEGTTTKLEPGTDLFVSKLESNLANQPYLVLLKQLSGKIQNQVTRLSDDGYHFEIQTPAASVIARGTEFMIEVDESGRTLVQTTEGKVDVGAQGQELRVSAGWQTEIVPGTPPSVSVPLKNELVFTISRPAVGVVVDPSGSTSGYLPDGSLLNQITGSRSSVLGHSQHTIRITDVKDGEYTVILRGVDEGTTHFIIEGLAEGNRTFKYAGACDVTTQSEHLLRLNVDILDGSLLRVSLVNTQPIETRLIVDNTAAKTSAGHLVSPDRVGGFWSNTEIKSFDDLGEGWMIVESDYPVNQTNHWVLFGFVAILCTMLPFVLRRR